ncbi:Glucuronate isomerase, partial [gut metagenome]
MTGDASDREKFQKWAETLEMAIGNPLYHWSHLELKKYFGYEGHLCGETAQEVWDLCNEKIRTEHLTARKMVKMSNVNLICTTDDPVDSLEWHRNLAEDKSFATRVLPAWRPDKAMYIEKPNYTAYIDKLAEVSGVQIDSFEALKKALSLRMDFFQSMGCVVSDHGLEYVMHEMADEEEIERIFKKRLSGEAVSRIEELRFKTAFMLAMGEEYARRGWIMQLHYGVKRDN